MLTETDVPRFELDGEQFVRPDFAGRGLANVAPTVLSLLTPHAVDGLGLPPLDSSVLPESLTRGVRTIVLVVADGLGHVQLQREIAAGNAPNLAELIARAAAGDAQVAYTPITSVFPTTTVAALGSVNSGVTPTQHGLLGYTVYLPEFDMVAEMIRWGPLNRRVSFADPEFGRAPEAFFWAETIYARLQPGVDEPAVSRALESAYAHSPFVRLTGKDLPEIKHVAHTNFCDIGWRVDGAGGQLVMVACIDNLVKGAAGQAIQNFNVAFGFDETVGLN